jgi:hypothetical protein
MNQKTVQVVGDEDAVLDKYLDKLIENNPAKFIFNGDKKPVGAVEAMRRLQAMKGYVIKAVTPGLGSEVSFELVTNIGESVEVLSNAPSEEETDLLREFFLCCWDDAVSSPCYKKDRWKDLRGFLEEHGWRI